MNVEDFRRYGHELIDWIADYREKVQAGEFPVLARAACPRHTAYGCT